VQLQNKGVQTAAAACLLLLLLLQLLLLLLLQLVAALDFQKGTVRLVTALTRHSRGL
jgi:hypothetical protein